MIYSLMCKVCVAIFVFATAYGVTKSLNTCYVTRDMSFIDISKYSMIRYFKLMTGFWFIAQTTSFIGDRYKIY